MRCRQRREERWSDRRKGPHRGVWLWVWGPNEGLQIEIRVSRQKVAQEQDQPGKERH